MLRVEAYDMDKKDRPNDLGAQDFIGAAEFTLASIVSCRDQRKEIIMKEATKGTTPMVIIQAEEKKDAESETFVLQFNGQLASNSSFFIIWKSMSPGKYKPVYKSEA